MKKLIISVITSLVFLSCQKSDEGVDPVKDALTLLQGRYLVCDSVKTTVNGRTTTQVLGKGKGWDRRFGIYADLEIYSSPTIYKGYQYESPNKIYYWNANTNNQTEQYYTIQSANVTNLVLLETEQGTGKIFTEFFTAE